MAQQNTFRLHKVLLKAAHANLRHTGTRHGRSSVGWSNFLEFLARREKYIRMRM